MGVVGSRGLATRRVLSALADRPSVRRQPNPPPWSAVRLWAIPDNGRCCGGGGRRGFAEDPLGQGVRGSRRRTCGRIWSMSPIGGCGCRVSNRSMDR